MGREVRRVPMDFDWPLNEVWKGYLSPDSLDGTPCRDCNDGKRSSGYSPYGNWLHDLWYGYVPFDPRSTGSVALAVDTPEVWAFASRNVERSPGFYSSFVGATGDEAIRREAKRLIDMWNNMWSHHLSQHDVDALVAVGRLRDFTHSWDPERRWVLRSPLPTITALDVNRWSLSGFGHDAINCSVVMQARAERDGLGLACGTCEGHGSIEAYPGQRADADEWRREDPPTGEGWQYWETVSEGSPISPVFAAAAELSHWLQTGYRWGSSGPLSKEQADRMVEVGWAPSLIGDASGIHVGDEVA